MLVSGIEWNDLAPGMQAVRLEYKQPSLTSTPACVAAAVLVEVAHKKKEQQISMVLTEATFLAMERKVKP